MVTRRKTFLWQIVRFRFRLDEKSLIQDTVTTLIIDYPIVKKGKDDLGHIMISYNHSTRPLCMQIAHALRVKPFDTFRSQLRSSSAGSGLSRLDRSG